MAKRRHRKTTVPRDPLATGPGAPTNTRNVYRHIWTDFLVGVLLTLGLLGAKLFFERIGALERVELAGYNWLQDWLAANFEGDDFPIQVLDIGNLRAVSSPGALTPVTPRERLFKLIEAVVAQKPRAVGVDIDFSPTTNGYRDPQHDPWFFRSIAELRKRFNVPIFLGIADSAGLPPAEWLPREYEGLGACILIRRRDTRRMLRWIRVSDSERGPTMCSALAARTSKEHVWAWALEESAIAKLSDAHSADEFTVDYSPLKTLEHDKLHSVSPESVAEEKSRFNKKIVLIGDATLDDATGGDTFLIPGRPGIYPGIYVHACATYTLLRPPLYELTMAGRISLDLLISFLVLWPVFAIRHRYAKIANRTVAVPRVQMFLRGWPLS